MSAAACDACLQRSWLLASLSGALEAARGRRRRIREVLALPDEDLIALLCTPEEAAGLAARERTPGALRAAVTAAGLEAVCRHDETYPARLADLRDAPATLFVAGSVRRLAALAGGDLEAGALAVAIVGTRRASPEGLQVARALGRGLAAAGVSVVSGMALGVDSAAHAGALEGGGATVAVLAGGADVSYPRSKAALHARIAATGCVVSELPPGSAPLRWGFPARNRIIAALASMTIVVEAAERSGSLITAEVAADIGREVGAVPGAVTSWRAAGANALLRDGATLIRDARDVLDSVPGDGAEAVAAPTLPSALQEVLDAVSGGRDTLAALTARPKDAAPALAALTELELLGRLARAPGGRYVVVPR
ncbi:MAG: DNA-processing protein DprA [Solirubrobacteraceae bacterium]